MLAVLRTMCTVLGALLLYSALMAALWFAVMRAGKRRARIAADRRMAARELAVTGTPEGRDRRAKSWEELPGWLWRDPPVGGGGGAARRAGGPGSGPRRSWTSRPG